MIHDVDDGDDIHMPPTLNPQLHPHHGCCTCSSKPDFEDSVPGSGHGEVVPLRGAWGHGVAVKALGSGSMLMRSNEI